MSEKQAKKLRKAEPVTVQRKKKDKTNRLFNAVVGGVVAVVIAVGGYAVWKQYTEAHPSTKQETVKDRAKTEGITTEEFLTKYGLDTNEEINGDTTLNEAQGEMSLTKYAECMGVTVDDVKANNRMPDTVTDDMKVNEAIGYVKMSDMAQLQGTDIATIRETYGLTEEELPDDMMYKDANEVLSAAYSKLLEEMMGESGVEASQTGEE